MRAIKTKSRTPELKAGLNRVARAVAQLRAEVLRDFGPPTDADSAEAAWMREGLVDIERAVSTSSAPVPPWPLWGKYR